MFVPSLPNLWELKPAPTVLAGTAALIGVDGDPEEADIMQRWPYAAILAAFLASPALAQAPPGSGSTPPAPSSPAGQVPPGMGGGVGQMPPEAGPPAGPTSPGMMGAGPERGMMGHHPPPRGPGEEHWHHHMMMMQSKGAMFYFRRGNSSIMVKCAENESTQVCVNAAATLLDKIRQSGGQHESGGRPPGQ